MLSTSRVGTLVASRFDWKSKVASFFFSFFFFLKKKKRAFFSRGVASSVFLRAAASGSDKKGSSSSMDLFEELESYEEKTARQAAQAERSQIPRADGVKRILAKEPKIRGSPRRLNIIAGVLVGKSYPELMQMLPTLRNTGARSAERAVENARRRAQLKWEVPDENRLVVEQAWVGKGEMQPRLKIHARGKTGIMHRRWGKMWVQMRYISPEDDESTFLKTCQALEAEQIPKHKVRYLLRYGPRTTVFKISKAAGLTRQQGRSYLKHLTNTRPEFRRLPFDSGASKSSASVKQ